MGENGVDLVVGGETRLLDGGEDAVEAELAVDVGLELLAVDGLGDGARSGVAGDVLGSLGERHYSGRVGFGKLRVDVVSRAARS